MSWVRDIGAFEVVFMAGVAAQAALAALAGMRVEVVSFGYGPRLLRAGRVQLALFPLGGYVRVAGLHPTEGTVDSGDRRAFFNRPWPLRALVVLGWPIGALLLLMTATAASSMAFGRASSVAPEVVSVTPGSPAGGAGLRPGDEILTVDGAAVTVGEVSQRVSATGGRPFAVEVRRAGQRLSLSATAAQSAGEYRIGVNLTSRAIRTRPSLGDALVEGARAPLARIDSIVRSVADVVAGEHEEDFRGPVAIAEALTRVTDRPEEVEAALVRGTDLLFWSLLPVPPMPVGQLLLVLLGWRSRRRRSAEAARDLGQVAVVLPCGMPPTLLAAILALVGVAVAEAYPFLETGPWWTAAIFWSLPPLVLAGALALRRPRVWAWGVYAPLLQLPTSFLAARELAARPPGTWAWVIVVLLLVAPAALLTPAARRAFGRECLVCHRLAAAPVRSSGRTSCLACGSGYAT